MHYAPPRGALPYRLPSLRAPLRVAFVGQSTFFRACALEGDAHGLRGTFVEHRAGGDTAALVSALAAIEPHVVVVFRPEIVPAGAFAELPALTVGFLTEPLPRRGGSHPDLERRLRELAIVDAGNFDRIVAFDPLIAETAQRLLPVWRAVPLPVADRYYREIELLSGPPRVVFIGRSTEHRENMLLPAKHQYDVLHLAHGVDADMLERTLDEHDVGINLHNEPYPSFENRVCLHLAAGHLVLSEPLSPTHGLEPAIDYLVITGAGDIVAAIDAMRRYPGVYHRVRVRGRRKAESFRASHVYPRLMRDLLADVATFGTERPVATAPRQSAVPSA
jgi:hypothetical protein